MKETSPMGGDLRAKMWDNWVHWTYHILNVPSVWGSMKRNNELFKTIRQKYRH